ncbi:MAG: hypothetical protein AAFV88_06505 [Planctomycetota bacterium]
MQASAAELYSRLEEHLNHGDVDGSLQILDQICRQHEDHAGAWELRGLLESKAGRPNLAIAYFQRAAGLAPLEPWSSRMMAIQYIGLDQRA